MSLRSTVPWSGDDRAVVVVAWGLPFSVTGPGRSGATGLMLDSSIASAIVSLKIHAAAAEPCNQVLQLPWVDDDVFACLGGGDGAGLLAHGRSPGSPGPCRAPTLVIAPRLDAQSIVSVG
jgi:hypothetical protein